VQGDFQVTTDRTIIFDQKHALLLGVPSLTIA
jgi:hypothetical protein